MRFGRRSKSSFNLPITIFIFGTVLCFVTVTLSSGCFDDESSVVSVANVDENDSEGALAEPFGYFRGDWNLWEFIGDSVSSLVTGY